MYFHILPKFFLKKKNYVLLINDIVRNQGGEKLTFGIIIFLVGEDFCWEGS
jgi:hypothetical protein